MKFSVESMDNGVVSLERPGWKPRLNAELFCRYSIFTKGTDYSLYLFGFLILQFLSCNGHWKILIFL